MELFDYISSIKYSDGITPLIWSTDFSPPELVKRANDLNLPYVVIDFTQWYPQFDLLSCNDGMVGFSPLVIYMRHPRGYSLSIDEIQHVYCEFLKLPNFVTKYKNVKTLGIFLDMLEYPHYTEKEDLESQIVYNVRIRR